MPDLKDIVEQDNIAFTRVFKDKISGYFLIDIKNQVMKVLGLNNLKKYYDFSWSYERIITGIGEGTEYDICRMIVGIHRANSIFLTDTEVRRNEKSKRYKQQLISETIEKIKLRLYGSVYFRKKSLFRGEEFLYYPLPYELFAMSMKMNELLGNNNKCSQLYYGVVYNCLSALSLLEDNLLGTAYPLCRGAIEMYFKLLLLVSQPELSDWYEKFRMFEIKYSCNGTYPKEFSELFEKRKCESSKAKASYLHFGWVDSIDGYHEVVNERPYSVSGICSFVKIKNEDEILGLKCLEKLYKECHAYTHGSIQTAKYPVLHYFEISIMLYYIIRETFLLLCKECNVEALVDGHDIISMIDRDFKVLYDQYQNRSTENFEKYYNSASTENI
ncbi:MAG: hypothetical protein K2G45_10320 [Lachnospiraceae bacterium]|nr:hypothetical protein [Lachnospiraceae bacterium]